MKIAKSYVEQRKQERLQDKMMSNKRENSVLLIQRFWRGSLARAHVSKLRKELQYRNAAENIQRIWRGHNARIHTSALRQQRETVAQSQCRTHASIQIQRIYRGYKARQVYKKQVHAKQGIIKLQSLWRGYIVRSKKQCVESLVKRRAAITIQCMVRKMIAKKRYEELKKTRVQESFIASQMLEISKVGHHRGEKEERESKLLFYFFHYTN